MILSFSSITSCEQVNPKSVLNKEEPPFGTILPARQQFFRTPFSYSDDAAGRKVRKRMHVSVADLAVKKSSSCSVRVIPLRASAWLTQATV